MTQMLSFRDVTLAYDGDAIIAGASLSIGAGEVVGLVGPNGAGKTTLLRAVTGGVNVTSGTVCVMGGLVTELSARDRARAVAVLPQTVVADAAFTAADFVGMGRHAHQSRFGGMGVRDREVCERAMRRTDTADLAGESVTTLSGGDLQRLALAQALAQEPAVLLLDEPTSHLDVNHQLQILDLCRGLADEGMAVLGVFHDLDVAARYADRIAVLESGRLVEEGPPPAVLRPDLLRDVFGVRAVVHTDPATQSVAVTPLLRDEDISTGQQEGSVLVVGGSGHGAWLMGALVRDGWDVSLAAIAAGDTDHAVASVLGVSSVQLAPFGQMSDDDEARVAEVARRTDAVIVSGTPFGRANIGNLRATVRSGTPLVLVGTMDERDYAGGEAERLWDTAVAAGAVVVDDGEAAMAALSEVIA